MSQPGAVVIGGYANGVSAIRGLARQGVRTAVILTKPYDIAHLSRYTGEAHRALDLHQRTDTLLEVLETQRHRWPGWALIPANDYALEAIARHREQLAPWYALAAPEIDVVRRVLDKQETLRLAEEVGVDVPRCYGPATVATANLPDIQFPVVVKAREGALFWDTFAQKLFVARDRAELVTAISRVERAGIAAEVFDLIPGPDRQFHNYTAYMDSRGNPAAEFAVRKLRKAPPFYGVARAAEVAHLPELRERTIELLRRIGWRGIASAEYKLDPRDGRYRLMEINGRCFLMHGIATRGGVNYPLLAWREQALGERVSATPNGWRGVWLHMHADLLYTAVQERGGDWSWREFFRTYGRTNGDQWVDAVWSWEDPRPFLAQWAGTTRKAARAVWARGEREAVRARFQAMPPSTA